ncbi:MAG: tetratricopeptide repeat protein, partial [Flammeovirgaceae bacterium]
MVDMYKTASFLFFILLLPLALQAQKIKYKELITLLNARQFEKAEPFLKRYLKETSDNPNAYLFMGLIFFEKATNNDILKNTDQVLLQCDSAILFFDKAYSMVTEKELKRNDEYYQMYSRRDLRTGEFGIKLSDVRLDLENRTASLKERKERIKVAKKNLLTCERLYQQAVELFVGIRLSFASDKELLLRSDETIAIKLSKLTTYFDSTMLSVTSFKSALKQVGKTMYNPTVTIQEINDLGKEGSTNANFLENDIKLWNYKKWAANLSEKIKNEIIPLREGLIAFDISLNKLRDKCVRDSVSVYAELGALSDNILLTQLKKYDDDPLPIAIFNMKKAELEYLSDKIRLRPLQDSLDVNVRLSIIKTELTGLKK